MLGIAFITCLQGYTKDFEFISGFSWKILKVFYTNYFKFIILLYTIIIILLYYAAKLDTHFHYTSLSKLPLIILKSDVSFKIHNIYVYIYINIIISVGNTYNNLKFY